ncbi:MAG: GAF domain-containing protein [Pseudoxanthomonas suwonensis]|nr:GAF domain-containing protein [Pseudoxanthomonas suwonensis]
MTPASGTDASLQEAIDNCAREPIHASGAIQPHGYLIACDMGDWRVSHVSANLGELFDEDAASLVGRPLSDLLEEHVVDSVRGIALQANGDANARHVAVANIGVMAQLHEVSTHVAQGLLHIELQPHGDPFVAQQALALAHRMIAHVEGSDASRFHQEVAEHVRRLVGYDRVMVYRFDHDDAGEVIAESLATGNESYLEQRFPASDIPPQARALYLHNRVRVIPDVRYQPTPIVPAMRDDGQPLDLSGHLLRSVSPVHLEYLRNMGVAASMSISIVVHDRLWGLIACHHGTPRHVSASGRVAAELLCQFVSLHLSAEESAAHARAESAAEVARDALALRLGSGADKAEVLAEAMPTLAASLRCDGIGAFVQGHWLLHGSHPDADARAALLRWADARREQVFASAEGAQWHPAADNWPVAGVLALAIGSTGDYVFGFRDGQARHVRWAGRPDKRTVDTAAGPRLAPRRSFAEWEQTVHGTSRPWEELDLRLGQRLHALLRGHGLTSTLANDSELDAFRRRHLLQQSRGRLQHLDMLLQQLVAGGMAETASLDARLAALAAELEALERNAGRDD